jgi:hypothetical protein
MNIPNSFTSVNITAQDLTVYQITQYDFNYQFSLDSFNSSKNYTLIVNFPSTESFVIVKCSGCSEWSSFKLLSSTGIVSIDKVKNPYKTSITSPLTFNLYIDGFMSLTFTKSYSTFQPIDQQFSISQGNYIMGQPSTLSVLINSIKK